MYFQLSSIMFCVLVESLIFFSFLFSGIFFSFQDIKGNIKQFCLQQEWWCYMMIFVVMLLDCLFGYFCSPTPLVPVTAWTLTLSCLMLKGGAHDTGDVGHFLCAASAANHHECNSVSKWNVKSRDHLPVRGNLF